MADTITPEKRSWIMSRIRSTGTKPEEFVRKYLFAAGLRYRKNDKRYPGKPDIVLPKYKTAIYVNGCFWHMHDCKKFVWPKSNTEYWISKLTNNKNRDLKYYEQMKEKQWKVIVVWECEINETRLERLIAETRGEYLWLL